MKKYTILTKYIIGLVIVSFSFFLFVKITAPVNISPRNTEFRLVEMERDVICDLRFENNVYLLNDKYYRLDLDVKILFEFMYYVFFIQFIYTLLFLIVLFFICLLKK